MDGKFCLRTLATRVVIDLETGAAYTGGQRAGLQGAEWHADWHLARGTAIP